MPLEARGGVDIILKAHCKIYLTMVKTFFFYQSLTNRLRTKVLFRLLKKTYLLIQRKILKCEISVWLCNRLISAGLERFICLKNHVSRRIGEITKYKYHN